LWRGFTLLAGAALILPLHTAASAAPLRVTQTRLLAPDNVGVGGSAQLLGQLTAAGRPVPGQQVTFLSRTTPSAAWHMLGSARTGFGGWASWQVPSVAGPTEFGLRFAGLDGFAASSTSAATVHVIDVAAAAPDRVQRGRQVAVAGHLTMDGRGLGAQPLQFMVRRGWADTWHPLRSDTADKHGWARAKLAQRFAHSFQVGVRFEGTSGLSASPVAVATVRVVAPPKPPAFVFPFGDPAGAMPSSAWSQDQGVDLAYSGYGCGSSAPLVAIGNGVVVQEGIDGFGPTAPVMRMTSGVFSGRYVYYGHTGRVVVHVGQAVQAGQKIAEVGCGSVGYSSAPHLEIGVGVPGGPTCCPAMHQTSAEMWKQLIAAL
jgi:murein DD-endopeptidase MepM/ murein hydrolase activator NlpD